MPFRGWIAEYQLGTGCVKGTMKRVLVRCYEPIAVDQDCRQPWSDVWIRYKARPGRRVYGFAPTLISHRELLFNLRQAQDEARTSKKAQTEVKRLENVIARLQTSAVYVEIDGLDSECPNIYSAAKWIDRREAETMLRAFMALRGFRWIKFLWSRPRLVVQPVSSGLTWDAGTQIEGTGDS